MICPHCHPTCNGIEHEGCQRSTIRIVPGKPPTDIPKDQFFDEDGVWHSHNPNIIVTQYRCSNGHRFAERSSWECGECGYKACEAEIIAAPPADPVPAQGAQRRGAGVVLTAEQRKAINDKKRGQR